MKTLLAPTEDFIILERTELDADVSAGSNVTLTLQDNSGFSDNDYIVVGQLGAEKTELQQINAAVTAGTDVQVATLLHDHKKGAQVYRFRYNQRKFYGATESGGTFTELTADGSPVTIQVDDPQGTLLEYTGNEGYLYFKATYYNAETTDETAIGDSDEVEADESKRYCSIYGIRKQGGFTENPFLTDGRIETKRKQAENEINSHLLARYTLPLEEIPPLIQYVCEQLAAGYLHYEEFGSEGDGPKMLGEARGILKSIQKGTQRLIKADGSEVSGPSDLAQLDGMPDGSETGRDKVKFQLKDRY